MYLAAHPPVFGGRKRLTRLRPQPKSKTHMSAKALSVCRFESSVATGHQAPEGAVAEIQFREALWREYRLEAVNAGFNAAQATEYMFRWWNAPGKD
jgi:hypothetical protein